MGIASSGHAKRVFFRDVSAEQSMGRIGQIPSLLTVRWLVFSVLLRNALWVYGGSPPAEPHPPGLRSAVVEEMSGAITLLRCIPKPRPLNSPNKNLLDSVTCYGSSEGTAGTRSICTQSPPRSCFSPRHCACSAELRLSIPQRTSWHFSVLHSTACF